MRLLANENVPRQRVEALRSQGHDVAWIRSDAPGSTDRRVLAEARSGGRILVTFDKDFGELAFREGLPAGCGVILLRLSLPSPAEITRRTIAVLDSRSDWCGHFSVIGDDHVRRTPLRR